MNYYNEHDPRAAEWLRELIRAGHIPQGIVDERSITEVKPHELTAYIQCHFFAGIGGWPYALALAGWPVDRPVWTGSCPCQPFSNAGRGLGTSDERHLWPVFAELIRANKPPVVFGEQVASKAGREWLAGVFADLEGMGYQRAGADLCAAGVGAPHIRQRLYWVANTNGEQCHEGLQPVQGESSKRVRGDFQPCDWRLGDTNNSGLQEHGQSGDIYLRKPDREGANRLGFDAGVSGWSSFDILQFRDGKSRRVESGSFPLAHGVSGRVGLLRGYGNAIVPQVAAEFVTAWLECENQFPGLPAGPQPVSVGTGC